jgi:hypothetical protein
MLLKVLLRKLTERVLTSDSMTAKINVREALNYKMVLLVSRYNSTVSSSKVRNGRTMQNEFNYCYSYQLVKKIMYALP